MLRRLIRKLGYQDEEDLLEYIKKPQKNIKPYELRISLSDRLKLFTKKNSLTQYVNSIQIFIALFFFLTHIYSTYFSQPKIDGEGAERSRELGFQIADLSLSFLYFVLLVIEVSMQSSGSGGGKWGYIFRVTMILELFTLIPVAIINIIDLILWDMNLLWPYVVNNHWFYYAFSLMMILRVGVVFRIFYSSKNTNVQFEILVLVSFILTLIYIFSSLIHLIENIPYFERITYMYYHDAVYMIFITVTTIGYGDVVVESVAGKISIICFFIIGSYIIITRSSQVFQLVMSSTNPIISKIDQHFVKDHIIVAGNGNMNEILEFIKEFLTESHGKTKVERIVVVSRMTNETEEKELKNIFRHPFFSERIRIYNGEIADFRVLNELNAANSHGVFLLCNFKSLTPEIEDTSILMKLLAIKNYHSLIKVFVLSMLESNIFSFYEGGADQVVNQDFLKLSLISQSLITPGLTTLISNLLLSTSAQKVFESIPQDEKNDESISWIKEYCTGCENEMYLVSFSKIFFGCDFVDVVKLLYEDYDLVLIGVKSNGVIELNPDMHVIKREDMGILFAKSLFHAHIVQLCQYNEKVKELKEITATEKISVKGLVRNSTKAHSRSFSDVLSPQRNEEEEESSQLISIVKKKGKKASKLFKTKVKNMKKRKSFHSFYNKKRIKDQPGFGYIPKKSSILIHQNSFRLLPVARKYEDMVLKTSKNFKDHFVVMGNLHGIWIMIQNLRSRFEDRFFPIVLLSNNPRKDFIMLKSKIKYYEKLYFVKGDNSKREDLINCGVKRARGCVYLTKNTDDEVNLIDGEAIKTVLLVQSINAKVILIAEIVYRQNIQYLKTLTRIERRNKVSKFNLYSRLKKKVKDSRKMVDQDLETYVLINEQFASGRCFSRDFFVRLLANTFFNSEIVRIIEALCGYITTNDYEKKTTKVDVRQINVPHYMNDYRYQDVFLECLKRKCIVIGVYKMYKDLFHYVITTPLPDLVVNKKDKLFVISKYSCLKRIHIPNWVKGSRKAMKIQKMEERKVEKEEVNTFKTPNNKPRKVQEEDHHYVVDSVQQM